MDAEVLGVSEQNVASHQSFASHYGLPFLLLADVDNRVRKLYDVPASMGFLPGRVTYIIDKKGVVRHIYNSQSQAQRHVEEAIRTLEILAKEELGTPP